MSLFPFLGFLTLSLSTLLAFGLAVFVLTRNRKAWANRCLALGLAAIGGHEVTLLASSLASLTPYRLVLFRVSLAVAGILAPSLLAFSLTFGESNGYPRFSRWRAAFLGLAGIVSFGWIGLAAGHLVHPIRQGSIGVVLIGLDVWGKIYFCFYVVGLALVLFHLENLYRSAERIVRWNIRLLVVGIFTALGYQIVAGSFALLYGFVHPLYPPLGALAFLVGQGMIAFSLVRHRLLDVDIFVSRYVVYRSLTLALIGAYLLSLGVVAEVFQHLSMPLDLLSGTFLAILGGAVMTLLLLSENIRRRLQRSLHTHFYKHKYDYRLEWMEYTRRLSRATAVSEIAAKTVDRLMEVMWVRQAAMYTSGDSPGRMILAYQMEYTALPAFIDLPPQLIEELRSGKPPHGTDDSPDVTLTMVRRVLGEAPLGCHVPIVALDTLVGLLVVGPEVSGKPFGVDDRDLLAAVAAQAGALLLNARLSREASEGHELQVLARLSAFVAHDLKNMVSMMSLLMDNARLHIAKPEFQVDMLRALTDVTSKMRTLLASLSSPVTRTELHTKPTDLAFSIEAWMKDIRTRVPARIHLETRLDWAGDVRVDAEQLRSVLENLVLNSIEATAGKGVITIETLQENGHAVFTVSDSGRGMTQEFIQRRLFRPFQTTKIRGLGIGLYQCRHIVQSFGGTLTAESQEGVGTCMTIRIPVHSIPSHDTRAAAKENIATEYASIDQSDVQCSA